MSDYGEPWVHNGTLHDEDGLPFESVVDRVKGGLLGSDFSFDPEEASRIVTCVNALAGIDDPAAFVEAVRRLVKAAEWVACREVVNPPLDEVIRISWEHVRAIRSALADPALAKVRGE